MTSASIPKFLNNFPLYNNKTIVLYLTSVEALSETRKPSLYIFGIMEAKPHDLSYSGEEGFKKSMYIKVIYTQFETKTLNNCIKKIKI